LESGKNVKKMGKGKEEQEEFEKISTRVPTRNEVLTISAAKGVGKGKQGAKTRHPSAGRKKEIESSG